MGQNQSIIEEPYHKRHYNETNRQIQRQNSLSLSTTNLLLNRDPKRIGSVHNNSAVNLTLGGVTNAASSIPAGGPRSASLLTSAPLSVASTQSPLPEENGAPRPFIRLLPIQTEPVYFDESDNSDYEYEEGDPLDEEEGDAETKDRTNARHLSSSPSFLDGVMNVNSRLSRSDSYEYHTRDRLDFERAQDEEQEDLAYLSPVSGTRLVFKNRNTSATGKAHPSLSTQDDNHNDHARYFDDENVTVARDLAEAEPYDEDIFVKRYQLHDPPVHRKTEDETVNTTSAQSLSLSQSLSSLQPPPSLGPIREEDESDYASKRNSRAVADFDSEKSRTGQADSLPPLQESNVHNSNNNSNNRGNSAPTPPPKDAHHQERIASPLYEDMVKNELDKRIQDAVQQVEQKLSERVQRLEVQTGAVSAPIDSSSAQRKEIFSNVSQRVGDLDSRVNQMETMVSYKLVDIESKVHELDNEQQAIATTVNDVGMSGQSVGGSSELQHYQPGGGPLDIIADRGSIAELRQELQAFGMRYHEMNDGLLTDLMVQLREAKLMLFETVDETDQRLGRRVDRIEAEMHAKLLYDIESRIQERVRAMEQTSSRLASCFDKMEGRLGALETVLASRRPRPESIYYQQRLLAAEEDSQTRPYEQDLNSSPESTMPWSTTNSSRTVHGFDVSAAASSSSSVSLSALPGSGRTTTRPSRIMTGPNVAQGTRPHGSTFKTLAGPHSAGPAGRSLERAMTFDNIQSTTPSPSNFSQSLPHHNYTSSFVIVGTQKPLPAQPTLVDFKGGLRSTGSPLPSPTSAGPKPARIIRRPSSYKELLHFWKAGGSTPDLLQTLPPTQNHP
ncbi:hypothetical protein BGZ83_005873 [Gryganskiella cystojenkinii]|nr:hypothetical protein BGZ83_005873 [Gryganskiella cystojenkinii]